MKITFKIFGALLLLATGVIFGFYAYWHYNLNRAEEVFNRADYETAERIYSETAGKLNGWPLSKIQFFQKKLGEINKEVERINLIQAWGFYYQGYYEPEKYDLAEEIIDKELNKKKLNYQDQFYNLKTLIYWQKGVELFIKLGKKAADSKEIDGLLEKALESSGEAVKVSDGKDWDVKYNYEFLRQPKQKLMQNMQQQAKQKQKDREMRTAMKQQAEEKKEAVQKQQAEDQQKAQEKKMAKDEKMKGLIPMEKKERNKATEETQGTNQPKKKKKG